MESVSPVIDIKSVERGWFLSRRHIRMMEAKKGKKLLKTKVLVNPTLIWLINKEIPWFMGMQSVGQVSLGSNTHLFSHLGYTGVNNNPEYIKAAQINFSDYKFLIQDTQDLDFPKYSLNIQGFDTRS